MCRRPVIKAHDESETRIQMTGLGLTPGQADLLQLGFFGQETEIQVFGQWVPFSIEANCRSRRPLPHQPFCEIRCNSVFTLIAHDQCKQDSVVDVGPGTFIHITWGGTASRESAILTGQASLTLQAILLDAWPLAATRKHS